MKRDRKRNEKKTNRTYLLPRIKNTNQCDLILHSSCRLYLLCHSHQTALKIIIRHLNRYHHVSILKLDFSQFSSHSIQCFKHSVYVRYKCFCHCCTALTRCKNVFGIQSLLSLEPIVLEFKIYYALSHFKKHVTQASSKRYQDKPKKKN